MSLSAVDASAAQIKNLQRALNARGAGLAVDGIWGQKTEDAKNRFEASGPVPLVRDGQDGFISDDWLQQLGLDANGSPVTSGGFPGGGRDVAAAGGAVAVIAAGSRVKITANAINLIGGRAIFIYQSALEDIVRAMVKRAYANGTANSSNSEITYQASLNVAKTSTAGIGQDFTAAAQEVGIPIANVQVEIVGAGGGGGAGNPPQPNTNSSGIVIAGAVIVGLVLLARSRQ